MGIRQNEQVDTLMDDVTRIHTPVMLERCISVLGPALERPGAVLVDTTLGLGGHAEAFLTRFPELTLVGLDRDLQALALAEGRLKPVRRSRATSCTASTTRSARPCGGSTSPSVDGVLFDLGVSSMQLDRAERGFAYSKDAPLDMRMDQDAPADRRDDPRRVLRVRPPPHLPGLRRRETRRPLRAPHRAATRRAASRPLRRSRRPSSAGDARRSLARRSPGQARVPGAAHRGEPGAERARACRSRGHRRASRRRSHRRDVVPVARRPHRQARPPGADRVDGSSRACPSNCPQHKPELSLLVRGAELATDEEKAENPRATPVRFRAAERIRSAS